MSCCDNQQQANDERKQLPSFLQFTKHLTQFDLNTPSTMTYMRDEDEVTERTSQPNNIL